MSTQEDAPENGNGQRATVALVDAKVDGLKDLIRSEFKDVGRRLDSLAGLETRVRDLELSDARREESAETLDDIDGRVTALEQNIVTGDQVKTALEFDRDQRVRQTDAQFTRREKTLASLLAFGLFAVQIYQVAH